MCNFQYVGDCKLEKVRKNRTEQRELVSPMRLEFPSSKGVISPEPPEDIEDLADTGSGVPFCAGIGLFPEHLIVDAPFPLHVTGADKNTIRGGQEGVWVNVVLPAHSSNGPQLFRCNHVFVYIFEIGSKFIIRFLFLLRFGFALIPGLPYLVPQDCFKLRPWTGPLRTLVPCHQCQPEQECRVRCVACFYLKNGSFYKSL